MAILERGLPLRVATKRGTTVQHINVVACSKARERVL